MSKTFTFLGVFALLGMLFVKGFSGIFLGGGFMMVVTYLAYRFIFGGKPTTFYGDE